MEKKLGQSFLVLSNLTNLMEQPYKGRQGILTIFVQVI